MTPTGRDVVASPPEAPPRPDHSVHPSGEHLDERTRVLKEGKTFAVLDLHGDVDGRAGGSQGLYHAGTRFLSTSRLTLEGQRPLLLGSTVTKDNTVLVVDMTNPDIETARGRLPRDTLHLFRSMLLWQGTCYQRVRVTNHGRSPVEVDLALAFDGDFVDVFEVRGEWRRRRGRTEALDLGPEGVSRGYHGLDGLLRRFEVRWSPAATRVVGGRAVFRLALAPQEQAALVITGRFLVGDEPAEAALLDYDDAFAAAHEERVRLRERACQVRTSNEPFDLWVERSLDDLHMLLSSTEHGPYPDAGVPWFSTPFGRDGIITALECLWLDPDVARGVLRYLAATQATEDDPERDAEPGKILHETREGEMAALGEVPFGRYYGSIDATPLFVVLARAYHERTGDRETLETVWPAVQRALGWLEARADERGFLAYARRSASGLEQQGWKDSFDSVFHADGSPAEGPIALCEVQAFAYAAWRAGAALARERGDDAAAAAHGRAAAQLRERFEQAFWSEELDTYCLALDGRGVPCRVRTSNAGLCLYAGIAAPERAGRVAEALLTPEAFNGWGIRTVAATEARYNPMSYHNGTVWPHDTALAAAGMARYGLKRHALRVLEGLFGVSQHMDLHRMPELLCGFVRRPEQGPTLYPVACAPQAWSAAAVFLLLEACLGLRIRADAGELLFCEPVLPAWLRRVELRGLVVGRAALDLDLVRAGADVSIELRERRGDARVTVTKRV